ncbi:hypothetical protein ACP6JB_002294 [Aspergillus fumigatus]
MSAGVTVPLGARPSTGAGLWLQGGIGHLTRLYGLVCNAVVGVVAASVSTGQVLCIGTVPNEHCPVDAVRPENQTELLWAVRGAGTNIGIIISVTFKAVTAPTYLVRTWVLPLSDDLDGQLQLGNFDQSLASRLPANCCADAYLYWEDGRTHLGVTLFECFTPADGLEPLSRLSLPMGAVVGSEHSSKTMDGVEVFDADMYMSGMYGGHSGSKTSSVYSADLGPDPRDVTLPTKAFGPNLQRLARLKQTADPANVLAFTCPLPKASAAQKLIILVTGESGAGKDYCANVWVSVFTRATQKCLVARAVSISEATKREYAEATGANLEKLLSDRAYKEQHRSKLTDFFQDQVLRRLRLPEEHFLDVVHDAVGVDVLLVTGMRDEAPVAALSHLVWCV